MDIITKLKQSGLVGRGGACFPTWLKWDMVNQASGNRKYVICNASEGEPGVAKDNYILENHADRMTDGIRIAVDFLRADKAFIYINPKYYKQFRKKLKNLAVDMPIRVFCKHKDAGYVGGEETSAIDHIEGRRIEPRLRPPYPTTRGLWGCPTLVNNVETFYDISLIATGEYQYKRFYTINGDCLWEGVYNYPEDWTIRKILKETRNYPNFDFYAQVGGDASGEVLNDKQLNRPVGGSGSITVYSTIKHNPLDLMKRWIGFFADHSCGQCTPCREGVFRLKEIIHSREPDWHLAGEILSALAETSFCGLGCVVPISFRSFAKNVLPGIPDNKINLPVEVRKMICECFHRP